MALLRSILGLKPIYPTAWCKFMGLLLKTGQTTQSSSKEDDGYFEKGVAKSYTVLSTGAYSGTSAIVLNAKTHNLSNNCVQDNRTGLMWARYVPAADIGPDGNGALLWIDDTNDEDIFDFKDQANTKKLGGHSDWRVPNLFELQSLINITGLAPYIDQAVFPSTPSSDTWTSSSRADNMTYAFCIDFNYGHSHLAAKATAKCFCRLVRG